MKSLKNFLPLFLVFTVGAYAQNTYTWFGGDGDWEVAANWSPMGVPDFLDTAIIDSGTVTVTEHDSVANLHLSGILDGTTNLTVLNEMKWNDGQLKGSGILVIDSNATVLLKPLTNYYLSSQRKFYNYGTVNWDSGSVYIVGGRAFYNYGSFVDQTTKNQVMRSTTLESRFYNYGEYTKTGSGNTTLFIYLVNNGTMNFQNDTTVLMGAGSTSNDTIRVGANALLSIRSAISLNGPVVGPGKIDFGSYNITLTSSYNVTGSTVFSSGITTFSENASIDNLGVDKIPEIKQRAMVNFNTGKPIKIDSLLLSAGKLGGTDALTINYLLDWERAGISQSDLGTYQAGAILTIGNDAQFIINVGNVNNVFYQIDNFGTTIWKNGSATFYEGADFNSYGVFLDSMEVDYSLKLKTAGSMFNNSGTYIKSGAGGIIELPFVNKSEGLLKGSGTMKMTGGFTNEGKVSPGDAIGKLSILGSYSMTASSSLDIEIGGITAATEYDQLKISETASLGGALNIEVINDYLPNVGDEFQIMTFASGSGSFDAINGLDTGKGVAFEVELSATGVKLVTVEATPNTPPSTFNLISPVDKTVLEKFETIDFIWQASSDVEGDSLFYDLNIIGGSLDTTITHIADTLFKFISQNSLEYSTSYNWAVTVTDGISEVAGPDVFSFNTPLPDDIGEKYLNVPEKFNLAQNYPNPFNPVTTIQYDLPVTNNVVLKIFDLSGREVQTLVNGIKHAGRHKVVFDASSLASGVYYYQLRTKAGFMQTKKLILLR